MKNSTELLEYLNSLDLHFGREIKNEHIIDYYLVLEEQIVGNRDCIKCNYVIVEDEEDVLENISPSLEAAFIVNFSRADCFNKIDIEDKFFKEIYGI
jgi:hypothetical protein